jgi:streptogramin lyase
MSSALFVSRRNTPSDGKAGKAMRSRGSATAHQLQSQTMWWKSYGIQMYMHSDDLLFIDAQDDIWSSSRSARLTR